MPEIGEPETPQRQSQVDEQKNRLEGNLTTLHDSIEKLANRLSTVLRSSVPSEKEKVVEGKDSVELVQLARTIENYVYSVESATYKIEDMLERLEL